MIKSLSDDFNALAFMGYVYENERTRKQIQIAKNETIEVKSWLSEKFPTSINDD